MKQRWILFFLLLVFPTAALAQAEEATQGNLFVTLDKLFAQIVAVMSSVLFFSIGGIPFIVIWLIGGALFFTFRMSFINIRAFKHAIFVVLGHYDDPEEEGELTHFQALSAALSATVGLGNIAGVAIAISVGGPGAVLWMTLAGLFGMTSKFVECTLAQKYRVVKPDGHISGGPMYYLSRGLAERGLRPLGKVLAVLFSILCIGASLGGGNMFQANQSYAAVANIIPIPSWAYGLGVAILVALVILGGIKRIGSVAAALVPSMCLIYVLAALWILLTNLTQIPVAFGTIFQGAFSPEAIEGGFVGVLVQGIRRAVFSNEAGIGSAAIAHAAARTDEPVREGIVALLEPFIDTVVICNMTALVVVITGTYQQSDLSGVDITSAAFGTAISWFPIVLSLAVFLFAFSTMISWSYYGERAWTFLFGEATMPVYRVLFVLCVFLGSIFNLGAVLDFSDMMLLSMAFPNMLGGFILCDRVAAETKDYMERLGSGVMPVYK
ncbi:alanine:cation symporter family protein [Oscillatoriales cyanobacterium LEGE 11467]|uniref:Alanine:cation symporter family protein n=1 Tax=Zarconia navalis LEGE 11467 TaxID=1828826 RepID=A0A928VVI4_9CYAN|nr:alanine/glycine:cation symporter family protein [Zarconia navalis]MBE9041007.1 alanine:cation symporter family protein [Zarconia navalis LEGE 11467]